MSHEVESMFSGSMVTPWHKLGKVVEGQPTSADALKLAGLDWKVRCEPLQLESAEWRTAAKIPARAVVRDSDASVLGVVGMDYTPLQNAEAFAIADDLWAAGARWESAGSLYEGRRVWMLCRMRPQDGGDEIAPGDVVRPYLLVTTSHDGSAAVRVMLTSVRVVCANTLRMALGASRGRGDALSIRHTSGVVDRSGEAARVVARAENIRGAWVAYARKMAATRISDATARALAYSALAVDPVEAAKGGRQGAKMHEINARLRGANNAPGTLWGAVNAVTEFTSHSARAGRSVGIERMMNANDGGGDGANQKVWTAALELIGAN